MILFKIIKNNNDLQTKIFIENMNIIYSLISDVNIFRDLKDDISYCLTNELSKKEIKIIKKLNPNQKFGFISRKLMSIARKNDVNQSIIKEYLSAKEWWTFSKSYYKKDKRDEKYIQEFTTSIVKIQNNSDYRDLESILENDFKHKYNRDRLFRTTKLIVSSILEKKYNL